MAAALDPSLPLPAAPSMASGASRPGWPRLLRISLLAALAYGVAGGVAIALAGPPGYATPLYPPAGIALALLLAYGRQALPGIWLGAFALNLAVSTSRLPLAPGIVLLPLILALGATVQAAAGAALLRRWLPQPLQLHGPREILLFALLGGAVACTLSAAIATPALLATGTIPADIWLGNALTWWFGDTLGVVIGTPMALTLIGQPRADWRPRIRNVGLPMLAALALLMAGLLEFGRVDAQRVSTTFERDADRLAADAQTRLAAPLHALEALHSAARVRPLLDADALDGAARWWLDQPLQIQGMGVTERLPLAAVPAYEAAAQARGQQGFHVVDDDGGVLRALDNEVQVVRLVAPADGNLGALGINVLANPVTRAALLATRDSGEPAASAAFLMRRLAGQPTAMALYQALYSGEPTTVEARREQFRGAVLVTVRVDRALDGLVRPGQSYLRWCLLDPQPGAGLRRLAGSAGCEQGIQQGRRVLATQRELQIAGRSLQLLVAAPAATVPGHQREAAWLLSLAGLAAVAMLCKLLLTVTGHARRTEHAVQQATANLRREIVERTLAEDALRDSETRLRSILDHVPLGVMFLDPQGTIIDGNPRLAEMAGRSVGSLRGLSVADLVQPEEVPRIRELRRTLLAGGGSDGALDSLRLRAGAWSQDGELRVRVSVSALRGPDGRVLRLVSVLEDITEHLRLQVSERALHRAEAANRAKSDFLSRMSHELRTPLNAMLGFAQLLGLDREPELVAHQREWTQQIQRAGWHLLDMINETLDLARIESGAVNLRLQPVALVPLAAACQAMVAAAAEQRGVRIHEALADDAPAVIADPTRLKQVLTNLLSNAVKYNREGGSIQLQTRLRPMAADAPAADQASDWLEITVTDTGLGMSAQQLAGLFQPYNRLGREHSGIEGTGIGLVISQRLAELMGGTLQASSVAGQGSTFTLLLRASAAAELPLPSGAGSVPAPYQRRLVHYVEDNAVNVEVMRGVFAQRPQIELQVSTLGLDGLTAIRSRRPDLVLLDMQLPDISGLELLRHLKQNDLVADIPVIVVSADATTAHMERALTSGALHYVTKPLDVARFLALVDSVLESAESRWSM